MVRWKYEPGAFFGPTNNLEEARDRLVRSIEFQKDRYGFFVALKETDEAIGFCCINEVETNIYADSGLCIAK